LKGRKTAQCFKAFKVVVYTVIAIITYPTLFVKLIRMLAPTILAYGYSSSALLSLAPIITLTVLTELIRKVYKWSEASRFFHAPYRVTRPHAHTRFASVCVFGIRL